MQLPDLLIERSRLTKKITMLKCVVLAIILGILAYYYSNNGVKTIAKKLDYIGTIRVENEIFEDPKFDKMLDNIENDPNMKALIVQINSPGGSSGASEKIYHKLKSIGKKIPVVSSMGSLAASGGYIVALSTERIFALNMTLTGSIGVLLQSAEIVDLAAKFGVKFKNYKSSEFKASPNPTEVSTPEADKAIMDLIVDSHNYFISLVSENRKLDLATAKTLSEGKVYTGRQALENKLVDEIGTIETAINWLKTEKKLDKNIELREIEPKKRNEFLDMVIDRLDETSKATFFGVSSKLMTIYK